MIVLGILTGILRKTRGLNDTHSECVPNGMVKGWLYNNVKMMRQTGITIDRVGLAVCHGAIETTHRARTL